MQWRSWHLDLAMYLSSLIYALLVWASPQSKMVGGKAWKDLCGKPQLKVASFSQGCLATPHRCVVVEVFELVEMHQKTKKKSHYPLSLSLATCYFWSWTTGPSYQDHNCCWWCHPTCAHVLSDWSERTMADWLKITGFCIISGYCIFVRVV